LACGPRFVVSDEEIRLCAPLQASKQPNFCALKK
jgi:hypothetical protein